MKPFDLEAAKRGEPIMQSNGRTARFIAHVPDATPNARVVVMLEGGNTPWFASETGDILPLYQTSRTWLVMAPTPKRKIKARAWRFADDNVVHFRSETDGWDLNIQDQKGRFEWVSDIFEIDVDA